MRDCIDCDGINVEERIMTQEFLYGPPKSQVTLRATMPVFCCKDCGARFTDYRGEEARDAAVNEYKNGKNTKKD